ncbi:hypothetical protein SAMN05444158_7039 [Bradyrhizobium canariense]|uniref:Uncharacterized protein n=1 Tax=Bradyrhizobium canariense TaxID=255045 RepID=A0A1H2BE26_9BRAD|nr:hypothetical protein SAMN05444158_7039 [Bradyrhizobium canariense]
MILIAGSIAARSMLPSLLTNTVLLRKRVQSSKNRAILWLLSGYERLWNVRFLARCHTSSLGPFSWSSAHESHGAPIALTGSRERMLSLAET